MDIQLVRFAVRLYVSVSKSIISKPIIIFLLYLLLLGTSGTTPSLRAARKMLVLAISQPSLAAEQIDISSPNALSKQINLDALDLVEPQLDRHSGYSVKKIARAKLILEMAPLIHKLVKAETAADEAFIAQLKAQLEPMQEYLLEISRV